MSKKKQLNNTTTELTIDSAATFLIENLTNMNDSLLDKLAHLFSSELIGRDQNNDYEAYEDFNSDTFEDELDALRKDDD